MPGRHNVLNALAAIAVCDFLGVSAEGIKSAIEDFRGAGRRFEFYGEVDGFMLADDYAHHPTEIAATLSAAHDLNYNKVIYFILIAYILLFMGSREINTYGISSEDIAVGLDNCTCVKDFGEAVTAIRNIADKGDIVITMGGGDVYKIAHLISGK